MRTVQDEWEKFKDIFPGLSEVEMHNVKVAFYSGSLSHYLLVSELQTGDISLQARAMIMAGIGDELARFFESAGSK